MARSKEAVSSKNVILGQTSPTFNNDYYMRLLYEISYAQCYYKKGLEIDYWIRTIRTSLQCTDIYIPIGKVQDLERYLLTHLPVDSETYDIFRSLDYDPNDLHSGRIGSSGHPAHDWAQHYLTNVFYYIGAFMLFDIGAMELDFTSKDDDWTLYAYRFN